VLDREQVLLLQHLEFLIQRMHIFELDLLMVEVAWNSVEDQMLGHQKFEDCLPRLLRHQLFTFRSWLLLIAFGWFTWLLKLIEMRRLTFKVGFLLPIWGIGGKPLALV
jgi:hypothetical protein